MGIDIKKRDSFDLSFVTWSVKNKMQLKYWRKCDRIFCTKPSELKSRKFNESLLNYPHFTSLLSFWAVSPSLWYATMTLMNIQWIFQSWFGPLVIYSTAHFSVIFRIILHTFNFSPFHLVCYEVSNNRVTYIMENFLCIEGQSDVLKKYPFECSRCEWNDSY